MTFKTDSAPLLCLSERCVWFHSHLWIETAELFSANTLVGSKSLILPPVYCLNLMYDLEKNLATYSMLRHFIAFWKSCVNLKLDRSPEKLEGISSMLLTALCSYSPEMHNLGHDNTMTRKSVYEKMWHTDWSFRAAWSQLQKFPELSRHLSFAWP